MTRATLSFLGATILCLGCAAGEPIDEESTPGQLARDPQAGPVLGELYVEVSDPAGTPLRAEAVWVAPDYSDREPASCMSEEDDGCETWHAEFEAMQEVTVYAQVCGLLYLEQLDLSEQRGEAEFAAHLTVVGDTNACAEPPSNASPCKFEPAAVRVHVQSPEGEPLPSRVVWYEFGKQGPLEAICEDMGPSGCMLWRTQAHGTGRYRIWANTCGKIVGTDTFTVEGDPDACGPQIVDVTLPGDPNLCGFDYGN